MIHNVHSRAFDAPATQVGALLDSVASAGDRLWPRRWPKLRLDCPLAVGAAGGHGPIRYSVERYEPGRTIVFRFAPGLGVDGTHRLVVEPQSAEGCTVLRHVLEGTPYGITRVTWPLAVRWLHDALLDDLLDRAELELTGFVARPARWSPWVRFLRSLFAKMRVPRGPGAQAERAPAVHAANSDA
ncbi:MAG: SRPBCC family protein [Acidimicrobiia bacterium]